MNTDPDALEVLLAPEEERKEKEAKKAKAERNAKMRL